MELQDLISPRELLRITRATLAKAREQSDRISALWSDLNQLTELVTAWARREYTVVPWRTIATAVGALVYFVNPMDAMPDVVPGIGYLDDGAVLAFVAGSLHKDIELFQSWKEQRVERARRVNPQARPRTAVANGRG